MGMLSGVGFPMHRDFDVVYCTSPVEFQISRHTLAAMVLFAPPTSEQRYLLLAHVTGTDLPPSAGGIGNGREMSRNFF
jgi:hypothetical protein